MISHARVHRQHNRTYVEATCTDCGCTYTVAAQSRWRSKRCGPCGLAHNRRRDNEAKERRKRLIALGLYTPGATEREGHGLERPTRQPQPTTALPGTWAKVEVLAARCAAGEELWHPEDGYEGPPLDETR